MLGGERVTLRKNWRSAHRPRPRLLARCSSRNHPPRELGDTSPFPAELFVRRYAITPAESRVMMLLVQGMTISEAAEALGISPPTTKTHLARLFDKTGTSRQADLVRLAMSALAPTSAGS
jgi:DNA-binding CsgD family transcriptional regulator